MSVSYLIYTSTASRLLNVDELNALWKQASRKNLKSHISGLLLYQEGIFMQILEGDIDEILALYEKIKSDPRHVCEQQPITGEIPKRFFADWSMGFMQLEQDHNLPSLKLFINYIDELFIKFDKEKIDEILNFIFSYSKWSKEI